MVIFLRFFFRKNSNRSQFFICQTRSRAKHLDNKHVVFGKVVDGMDIVTEINEGPTDETRPKDRIVIADCGILRLSTEYDQ